MRDVPGHDGGGGPWKLRLVVVATLIVLVVLAVVHDRLVQPHPASAARTIAPATTLPSAPSSVPAPSTSPTTRRALVTAPVRLRGAVLRSDGDEPALLLGGEHPAWFSIATHDIVPIHGLPVSRLDYVLTSIPGGWAAQPGIPGNPNCSTCAGPPTRVDVVASGSDTAVRVGRANDVAPGAGAGDMWLTTFSSPQADTTFEPGIAREVDLAGRALGRPVRLPGGYLVSRGVEGGALLLSAVEPGPGQPSAFELWSPRSGRITREFPDVIAATPDRIAWLGSGCTARACPIHVFDLATGRTATVRPLAGYWASQGALSSDGQLLAVQMNAGAQEDGEAVLTRIEVLDTTTMRLMPVPGTRLGGAATLAFGWQPSSDCLLATVAGNTAVEQIATWHPGNAQLSVTAVRIPLASAPAL